MEPTAKATLRPAPKRLFVLFIHYNLREVADWVYAANRIVLQDAAKDRLKQDIDDLLSLLEPQEGWYGFAFLFLDPGWKDLFSATGFDAVALGGALENFQRGLTDLVGGKPIRLVAASRLIELLQVLKSTAPESEEHLGDYLISPENQLRYDSVKIVEAVIRIANISRNAPILRFDDDVIFPRTEDERLRSGSLERTREGIFTLCRRYEELSANPDVNYFVFSGAYLSQETSTRFTAHESGTDSHPESEKTLLTRAALDGFATRVLQLSKVPPLDLVEGLDPLSPSVGSSLRDIPWNNIDLSTITSFLGELWQVGANPFRQVISGAGLCLSDSAILDLPPFSNMRQNVMWIDDHLKFSLHHELGHFGLPPTADAIPYATRRRIGRVDEAWFQQQRHPKGVTLADIRWHSSRYLPRLLRGAIADCWLREDARLKCSSRHYADSEWIDIVGSAPGQYARHFSSAVRQAPTNADIRNALRTLALQRLKLIRALWSAEAYAGTFLRLVITGGGQEATTWKGLGFFPEAFPDGLEPALSQLPEDPGAWESTPLSRLVDSLIGDFLEYPKLVLFWKNFVQATRFLLNERPAPLQIDRSTLFWPLPIPFDRQPVKLGLMD